MKETITITKDLAKSEASIFNDDGWTIREVPQKVKTTTGWETNYTDIRELKIGAELDGGIVINNPYL